MAKVHVGCPTCGGQMLVFRSGESFWYECPNGHRIDITKDIIVDTASQSLAKCPSCGANYRVPLDKGSLIVSCTQCGARFRYNPQQQAGPTVAMDPAMQPTQVQQNVGPKTQKMKRAAQQPQQRLQPNPYESGPWQALLDDATAKAKAVMGRIVNQRPEPDPIGVAQNAHALGRRIVIERLADHGPSAMLPVTIYIDGRDAASLANGKTVILDCDATSHTVGTSPAGSGFVVPAGDADYTGYYVDKHLLMGPSKDDFRDALIGLVVKIFKGNRVREAMCDPRNASHALEFTITREGILLSWAAPDSEQELIPYEAAHLVPDYALTGQGKYWSYLNFLVHEAVNQDPLLDYGPGGFTLV